MCFCESMNMRETKMTCDNCDRETHSALMVYCCARATYLGVACSERCRVAAGGVDPAKVADCGEHCACGDCIDCELAFRAKAVSL